jgi:hypothetical protein
MLQKDNPDAGQAISTMPALSCGNQSAWDAFRQVIENSTPDP